MKQNDQLAKEKKKQPLKKKEEMTRQRGRQKNGKRRDGEAGPKNGKRRDREAGRKNDKTNPKKPALRFAGLKIPIIEQ